MHQLVESGTTTVRKDWQDITSMAVTSTQVYIRRDLEIDVGGTISRAIS